MTGARVGRLVASPRWIVVAGVLFWAVIPLLCLVSLGFGVDQLARHVNNIPAGTRGTFVVNTRTCDDGPCVSTGTFTSRDRSVVLTDARGDAAWRAGRRYDAVYDRTGRVVSLPNTWDPAPTVVGIVGILGFLGMWGWWLRRRLVTRPPPSE